MPVQNRRLPVEAWNPTSYKPTSKYVASGESLVAGSHLSQIFLVPSRLKQEPSFALAYTIRNGKVIFNNKRTQPETARTARLQIGRSK